MKGKNPYLTNWNAKLELCQDGGEYPPRSAPCGSLLDAPGGVSCRSITLPSGANDPNRVQNPRPKRFCLDELLSSAGMRHALLAGCSGCWILWLLDALVAGYSGLAED